MRPRAEQPVVPLILRALERDDLTIQELSAEIGVTARNLRHYLKLLHSDRLIHVDRWECHGFGPKAPVWGLGDFTDAPYPAPRTAAEQMRLARRRNAWSKINRI